jgi:hypothetical protein
VNILDDLREILTDEEIDIVMETIGGEMIWIPDFGWFCRRMEISDVERKTVIKEMVETYVRRDRETKVNKAGRKKNTSDSISLFGTGGLSAQGALGAGQAQSGDKSPMGKKTD